jgi:hypothetical protein
MMPGTFRTIRTCSAAALLSAGTLLLPALCSSQGEPACTIAHAPRTVAISASTSINLSHDDLQVCTGDMVTFAPQGKGSFTVQFSPTADPFGWHGAVKRIPASGLSARVKAKTPIGPPGDKYTVACKGCNPAVSPLDPHIIVLGR